MKYIILQRANPQDRRKAKWYATPLLERRVRQTELTSELTQTFGIRYGIVRKIIQVFLEAVVRHLLAGRSVCLRPLGTLRISFTSDGMEEPEHVTPDTIRDLKIVITPDKLLKEQLSNLHFELHEAPTAAASPHESVVEMMPRAYPRGPSLGYDPPGGQAARIRPHRVPAPPGFRPDRHTRVSPPIVHTPGVSPRSSTHQGFRRPGFRPGLWSTGPTARPGTGERPVGAPDHSQGRNPWAPDHSQGRNPGTAKPGATKPWRRKPWAARIQRPPPGRID